MYQEARTRPVEPRTRTALRMPPVSVPARLHRTISVLLWQARGSSECALDGGAAQRLTAGHALWIPPKVKHEIKVASDSVIIPLHMRARPAPGLLQTPTWIGVDGELRTHFLALLQVQTSVIRPEGEDLERRVVRLVQERTVPPTGLPLPSTPEARAIAMSIRDHPGDQRSIDHLAETQHVSTRTIERAFLAETGMTLREWRANRRMEVASALLRRGDATEVVAIAIGYRGASAFGRAFKARFGVPPGEYARRFASPL